MKLPEWILDQLRRVGADLIRHPEKFTGNVKVNSFEGGVTNLNVEISVKVKNGAVIGT